MWFRCSFYSTEWFKIDDINTMNFNDLDKIFNKIQKS